MTNSLYDTVTLTTIIGLLGIIIKAICANNKSTLTKIIMGVVSIGLLTLLVIMVVDIGINGS